MKYKLVIFDLDGTIADTSGGIKDAHRFTLEKIGKKIPEDGEISKLIGGQLFEIYKNYFALNEEAAKEALKIYRKRYSYIGIHESVLYLGFDDMLQVLKKNGIKTGVATLKLQEFAETMLTDLGIIDLFDYVVGMDKNDKLQKSDIILKCIEQSGYKKNEILFVGDSENDLEGSAVAEVDFIGVTYGFGFVKNCAYDFITIDDPYELVDIISST